MQIVLGLAFSCLLALTGVQPSAAAPADSAAAAEHTTGEAAAAAAVRQIFGVADALEVKSVSSNDKANQSIEVTLAPAGEPQTEFVVELWAQAPYPTQVVRFDPPAETKRDISKDDTYVFDPALIDRAKEILQQAYGIDSTHATYTAYGYQNRVAVQISLDDHTIFDVRFDSDTGELTGVFYFQDAVGAAATRNFWHAKEFRVPST